MPVEADCPPGEPVTHVWLGEWPIHCQNSAHAATVEIFGHGGRLTQQKIQLHIAEAIIGQVQQTVRGQSECIGIQSPGDICSPLSQHCTNIDLCHRRSEERRVGKECVRTCSSRCSPTH